MKPSPKSPELDLFLKNFCGIDRVGAVESETCAMCGAMVNPDEFKDAISLKEYKISGMCQKCQDLILTDND